MGELLSAKCSRCGYSLELHTGGGRGDCGREAAVLALPGVLLPKTEAMSVFRRPYRCADCGALYARAFVSIGSGRKTVTLEGVCPRCGGGNGEDLSEKAAVPGACPDCQGALTLKSAGHWD